MIIRRSFIPVQGCTAVGTLPPNDEVPDCQGFMIELEFLKKVIIIPSKNKEIKP